MYTLYNPHVCRKRLLLVYLWNTVLGGGGGRSIIDLYDDSVLNCLVSDAVKVKV